MKKMLKRIKPGSKKKIIPVLCFLASLLLTSCNTQKSEDNGKRWQIKEISQGTEWNNNAPGLYGFNRKFISWEELEQRHILKIKNGKLTTAINDEDGNVHTMHAIKGTLIIPDTVTSIGYMVFANCRLLGVTIPDGVKTIGEEAFYECIAIKSIHIPKSVKKIGRHAFYNVPHIEYEGTAEYEEDDLFWGARAMN